MIASSSVLLSGPDSNHSWRKIRGSRHDRSIDDAIAKQKPKRRAPAKKKASADEGGTGPSADQPKLDKNLDTSKLSSFYAEFDPKNHSEKILIFLKFLIEKLNIEYPNTDQIFTCYKAVNEKIPQAFKQAFITTSGRYGYIDYKSPDKISIPIAGDNHFSHGLKKKAAE